MKYVMFFIISISLMSLCLFPSFVYADSPYEIKKDVDQLPHYLKYYEDLNKLENIGNIEKEIIRAAQQTKLSLFNDNFPITLSNMDVRFDSIIYGETVQFVLHNYVLKKNCLIYYGGEDTEIFEVNELDRIKKDLVEQLCLAIDINMKVYSGFSNKVITSIEKMLDIKNIEAIKDKEIEEYNITYGDLIGYFNIEVEDFIPREFHFVKMPAFGLCFMSTGVIAYNPNARINDYIIGFPSTIVHELVHNNLKLQTIPFASYFTPELQTTITEHIADPYIGFLQVFNSYIDILKKPSELYFSFDWDKMFRNSILYDGTNVKIDYDLFEKEYPFLFDMISEFESVIPDMFVKFYTNKWFWTGVNKKFHDDDVWFDIMMAERYDPTILRKDSKNTGAQEDLKFIRELDDSGMIKKIADKAWERLKEKPISKEYDEIIKKARRFMLFYKFDPIFENYWKKEIKKDPKVLDLLIKRFNSLDLAILGGE